MKFRSAMANNEDDHLLPETQQKFMQLLRRSFNETGQSTTYHKMCGQY